MNKILCLLALLLLTPMTFAQEAELKRAEVAYAQGNYSEAIKEYEEVLALSGSSAELYYNLGNSYFKANDVARAILNYERALLLDPSFENASVNLEFANKQILDKVEEIKPFFLKQWVQSMGLCLSSNAWARFALILFGMSFVGLFLYFFLSQILWRKIGFFTAICCFILSLCANYFASIQKDRFLDQHYAIIMEPTVTVKGSPAASGVELFVVHEGLKVKVKGEIGDWTEVQLADGNVGWMPSSELSRI